MIEDEIGKYKKRSTAKGQPRSKHKHIYETVLLINEYELPNVRTGRLELKRSEHPQKVCTICGRIEYMDYDPSYYEDEYICSDERYIFQRKLSDKALQLPKYIHRNLEKFATKLEECDE